jgi:hypothetical protein
MEAQPEHIYRTPDEVIQQLYHEDGLLPAEVYHDALRDPTVMADLLMGQKPERYGRRDLSINELIAMRGGLKDVTGELAAADLGEWHRNGEMRPFYIKDSNGNPVLRYRADVRRYPNGNMVGSLINNESGLDPNYATEAAIEAHYLPEGSTDSDLYDAMRKDAAGQRVYPWGEQVEERGGIDPVEAEHQQYLAENKAVRQQLAALGEPDVYGIPDEALQERLAERLGILAENDNEGVRRVISEEEAGLDQLLSSDSYIRNSLEESNEADREHLAAISESARRYAETSRTRRGRNAGKKPVAAGASDQAPTAAGGGGEGKGAVEGKAPPFAVGDVVQWQTKDGVDQMPLPMPVRAMTRDGKWAFVQGSDTAIPTDELVKQAAPEVAPEAPPAPPTAPPPGGMRPVAVTTPETAPSQLSVGTKERGEAAGAPDLGPALNHLVAHDVDQDRLTSAEIAKDWENAKQMAMDNRPLPEGILLTKMFKAVEAEAMRRGDWDTIRELKDSSTVHALTRYAQELRGARGDMGSAVDAVQTIEDDLVKKAGGEKAVAAKTDKELAKASDALKEAQSGEQGWLDWISEITCK